MERKLNAFRPWFEARWEVLLLIGLAAAVYQPWAAVALPILDFSEFLPRLASHTSPFAQFAAVTQYLATQGRFCLLQYTHVVIAWNLFGMWAPGWHWTYFALNAAVIVLGWRLLTELGVGRAAAFGALAIWTFAPPVAEGWVRPTGEPIGLIFLIAALRLAHNYVDAQDWRRRAILIAACCIGVIAAKEMLVVTLPVVWLMTRLRIADGKWTWAKWSRRDAFVAAYPAVAIIIALAPVVYVAMSAPPGNYAARYGSEAPTFADFIARLKVAALPSRAGLPSAHRFLSDPAWQAWLAFPNILWLTLVVCGSIAAFVTRSRKGAMWPLAIGIAWATIGALAYMPWPGLATFYMLPFAFGVAFVTAHAFNALGRFRLIRIVAALAMIEIIAVSAVEARDIVHEHELRVMTDADLIATIAHDGRREPIFAAVPNPAPVGSYGWAKKLAEYARVRGDLAPQSARDVSCAEGRKLLQSGAPLVVVTGAEGCGLLVPGSVVVSEIAPRRRWPWIIEPRANRRIAFVARVPEPQVSSTAKIHNGSTRQP